MTAKHGLLAVMVSVLAAAPCGAGQAPDLNADFIRALAQFSVSLNGAYGDEGAGLRASLDAMSRGLDRWDEAIRVAESAIAGEASRAQSAAAARMHAELGGLYLDRGRVGEALKEFTASSQLDPSVPEVHTLQALIYSQILNQQDAAIQAFQHAARLDVRNPERVYLLARQLLKAGRTDAAKAAFQAFYNAWDQRAVGRGVTATAPFSRLALVQERAGVEPFFPPVLYAEGFALLQRGELEEAIAQFRDAATRDPLAARDVNRLEAMGQGAAALREGSVQTAIRHFTVAIELEPNRAEAHRLLGTAYAGNQRSDEAIAELRTAVRLDPGDERSALALADALVDANRFADAEQALAQASQAFPSSGRAHYVLGRLYQRQSQYDQAQRELDASIGFQPLLGVNGIYQSLGAMSAARQRFDAALEAYEKRVDVHPNDADAHQDLGDTYARVGRNDEALAEFAVTLMLGVGRAEPYAAIAQVHLKEGRYTQAAEAARYALTLDARHAQARLTLGTSLVRLGRAEEGQKELEAFQRLQTEAAEAHARELELGGLRRDASESSAKGDHEKAVALLQRALAIAPDEAVSHVNLGLALLYAGHAAEAVERFNAAVGLNGPPEVHLHLAEAYAALGRTDESRKESDAYQQLKQDSFRRAGTEPR